MSQSQSRLPTLETSFSTPDPLKARTLPPQQSCLSLHSYRPHRSLGAPPRPPPPNADQVSEDSQPKVLRTTPPQQRIRRINRICNLTNRRAPPPRGTPGAEQADEECTPPDKEPHAQSRGAGHRRAQCKQCLVRGAGSRTPAPCQLTKATPSRAKWFRQAMLWQHTATKRHERKKRVTRYPTTPPLPYSSKLRIGSLNVQGFADTLKLKTALQVMERHRMDVLMLTETKSTSYYSYVSEEHLVILSGNNRDKHAGVGAIITPPTILDGCYPGKQSYYSPLL